MLSLAKNFIRELFNIKYTDTVYAKYRKYHDDPSTATYALGRAMIYVGRQWFVRSLIIMFFGISLYLFLFICMMGILGELTFLSGVVLLVASLVLLVLGGILTFIGLIRWMVGRFLCGQGE